MSKPARDGAEHAAQGAVVVIPVKAFAQAKMRLSPVLTPTERSALARRMAERVLTAARPLPVAVVCDDHEVEQWAAGLGARALVEPGAGLNGAVTIAYAQLVTEGYDRVVIAHGDLPFATDLGWLAEVQGVAIVPDRREEGTNVLSLPAGCRFCFSYGPGSFLRHCQQAERSGLPWQVVRDADLAWDVDLPSDMVGAGL